MNGRSRVLSAALACLAAAVVTGCGEKEEPELGDLPPPPAGAAPGGRPDGKPEPTEGRPVTSDEGAIRRVVVRELRGQGDGTRFRVSVDQVEILDGRATAVAHPRGGPDAGERLEVELVEEGRRWRVDTVRGGGRGGS
jgi:hypothetical protein